MWNKSTNRDLSVNTFQPSVESTPGENFSASIGLMIDEELTISKYIGAENFRERAKVIREMNADGRISDEVMRTFKTPTRRGTKTDYDGIAKYANENNLLDKKLKTSEQLVEERNTELDYRRKYRDDIFERAGIKGDLASFGGTLLGSSLDPLAIASMFVAPAYTGAKSVSRTMYALSQAGKGAAAGIAGAAVIEPFIHTWKEEIDAEYTLKDTMFNLAASGILGGSINGVAGALSHRAKLEPEVASRVILEDVEKNTVYERMTVEDREMMAYDLRNKGIDTKEADDMAQFAYDVSNYPDQKADATTVISELEATQERMESGTLKEDREPSFGAEDVEIIDKGFEEVKNSEIKTIFEETVTKDQIEIDMLQDRLRCLNAA